MTAGMTEPEMLERERKWVATRLNCGRDGMFDELVAVISFDGRAFNKLAGEGRKPWSEILTTAL